MLTNSRDIIRRLERDKWTLVRVTGSHHVFRVTGSHHVFKSSNSGETVVVPHPRRTWEKAFVRVIYKGVLAPYGRPALKRGPTSD